MVSVSLPVVRANSCTDRRRLVCAGRAAGGRLPAHTVRRAGGCSGDTTSRCTRQVASCIGCGVAFWCLAVWHQGRAWQRARIVPCCGAIFVPLTSNVLVMLMEYEFSSRNGTNTVFNCENVPFWYRGLPTVYIKCRNMVNGKGFFAVKVNGEKNAVFFSELTSC